MSSAGAAARPLSPASALTAPSSTPAGPRPASDDRRIPALDGLRGLAILLVVAHTSVPATGLGGGAGMRLWLATIGVGWAGVTLFFALSGYLITGILLDVRESRGALWRFYARRALRIAPPYLALLVFAFVVLPAAGARVRGMGEPGHIAGWWYWTWLANWVMPLRPGVGMLGHLWSLAVEEQFYLVWPLVVLVASNRRIVRLCVVLAVLAFAFRLWLIAGGVVPPDIGRMAAYNFTLSRCDGLLLGAAGATLERWRPGGAWWPAARRAAWVAAGALFVLALARRGLRFDDPWVLAVGQTPLAIVCAVAVVGAGRAVDGSPASRLVGARILRTLGKYSYAVYLVNLPMAHAFDALWPRGVSTLPSAVRPLGAMAWMLGALAASLTVAWLSWRVLEQPVLRLKRYVPRG